MAFDPSDSINNSYPFKITGKDEQFIAKVNEHEELHVILPNEERSKRTLSADRLAFGGLSVTSRIMDISAEFALSVPSGLFQTEFTGTGSNGIVNSKARVSTGTTPGSTGRFFSKDFIKYRPGKESFFLFTATFPNTGTTGDRANTGLWDFNNNGYWLGMKDGQFGVGRTRASLETFIPITSFNGDPLDGSVNSKFTRDGVPEAYDPTKLYIFEIVFGYLGIGNVDYRIQSPDGNWIIMHTIKSAGFENIPHSFDPNLPITAYTETTSGADMIIESSSIAAGYYGLERDNRISAGNTTTTLLGPGEEFTGEAVELLDAGQISVSFFSDQNSATGGVIFEYSHDGTTWANANTFTYIASGFRRFQYGVNARFFRVRYINGSIAQTQFSLQTLLLANPSVTSIHRLGDNTSADRSVTLVKAGITGESPDGDFTNVRNQGVHSANTTNTPLGGNAIFRGIWFQWEEKYIKMIASVNADVAGTLYIDYSANTNPVDGVDDDVEFSDELTYDPVAVSILKVHVPVVSKWVRLRYINGPAAQSHFDLSAAFMVTDPGAVLQDLTILPRRNQPASLVRNVPAIPNAAGTGYQEIPVRADTGNPKQSVEEIHDEVLLKALTTGSIIRKTVGTTPVRLDDTPLTGRKGSMITNEGNFNCALGFSSGISYGVGATTNLLPQAFKILPFDENTQYWVVAEDSGGTETTLNRSGTTATGTATSPSNALTSNDLRAIIDANAETLAVDGYTAGTTNDLVSVQLGVEARKQSGQTQTVVKEEVQNGTTAGAGSVSTASLAGGTDQLYLVYVDRNDNTGTVTQVASGAILFTPLIVDVTVDNRRIDVWYAYGDFAAGVVTASLSASTNASISAYRFSGVSMSTPIEDFGSTSGTGTAVTGPTLNGTLNGYSILGVSHDAASGTPGAGYIEDADLVTGTGSNRESLAAESKALTVTGTEAGSYTLIASSDWAALGVTLTPAAAIDPQLTLSYEYSAVPGATSSVVTVASETDTTYLLDITSDRSWIAANIANVEVFLTGLNIGNAAAEIDHLFIRIVDSTGNTTVVTIIQGAGEVSP